MNAGLALLVIGLPSAIIGSNLMIVLSQRPVLKGRPWLLGVVVFLSWVVVMQPCIVIDAYLMPVEDRWEIIIIEGVFVSAALIFGAIAGVATIAAQRSARAQQVHIAKVREAARRYGFQSARKGQ
jgi:hypothetical protein